MSGAVHDDSQHAVFARAALDALHGYDPFIAGRSYRVAFLTVRTAEAADASSAGPLRDWHVRADELKALWYASLLADIGMVRVPRELFSRELLSAEERLLIQGHVVHSRDLLLNGPWQGAYARVPEIAYAHHEMLDGSGYPRGLMAPQIPLESRMIAVADIFDALVAMDRPGKRAIPSERALMILQEEARLGRLDRDVVGLFIADKIYGQSPAARPALDGSLGQGR